MERSTEEKPFRLYRYPFLIIMTLIIVFLAVYFWCRKDTVFSEEENRFLATMPEFSIKSLKDAAFGSNYELYVNEQFPFRDQWISLKAVTGALLGKQENNGIIKGKNGFLFSKDMDTGKQINKNLASIRGFADMLAKQDEDYNVTVSIVPNSNSVLKNYLPVGAPVIDQNEKIEEYRKYLEKEDSLEFLDVQSILKSHDREEIYYRSDHHWTTLGAYYAYSEFVSRRGMEPVSLTDLKPVTVDGFYGTYDAKYKGLGMKADHIVYYDIPIEGMWIGEEKKDSLYDLSKLNIRDKYALFLYGNNPLTIIRPAHKASEDRTRKILVLKDSYANSLIPFLTFHYDEIYVADLRYFPGSIGTLLEEYGIKDIWLLYNFDTLVTDNHFYRLTQ